MWLIKGKQRIYSSIEQDYWLASTIINHNSPFAWPMSLLRFDRARSVESGSSAGGEVVPFDDESTAPSTVVAYEPWPNEPRSMEKLMDQHVVEAKFTGRTAGTSLILVNAASRDGKKINTVQDQEYKLFLVTSLSISLNVSHQGLNINL